MRLIKPLEETRQKGEIGSALAAEVTLYANKAVLPKLTRLGKELRFLLITSEASVYPMTDSPPAFLLTEYGVSIKVSASTKEKCARCWHRRPDVGVNKEHPELCLDFVGNISGSDETRLFI